MKKSLIFIVACLILSSCVTTSSLYYWGGESNDVTLYESLAYKTYDKQTPESICKLVVAYEDIVQHPVGSRQMPPPGICAEYGYLLLQPETAGIFAMYATDKQKRSFGGTDYILIFRQKGEEMMKKEMELYPESATFIAPLIKRFTE